MKLALSIGPALFLVCTLFWVFGLALSLAPSSANAQSSKSPWAHKCQKFDKVTRCLIVQRHINSKTKQQLLAVMAMRHPKNKTPIMRLILPFGLYLPGGVRLAIDNGKPRKLAIETCQQSGCFANTIIDGAMLKALQQGNKMTVGMQTVTRKPITITVKLSGFTAAFNKLR